MHSQSPILKTKGALSNLSNSYISMRTKLNPPYPNQTACLNCMNLDLKGVFNAWRMWAWIIPVPESAGSVSGKVGSHEQVDLPIHRLVALNTGVSTVCQSLPESNCSYLANIRWSVKELYSLWASCTVIKKTGFGITDQVISIYFVCWKGWKKQHICLVWNLRANYPWN